MATRESGISGLFFLQLAVSLFLIVSGLLGIMDYNSTISEVARAFTRAFGGRSDVLNIIVSVAELVSGAVLLIGLFLIIRNNTLFYATLTVFILWTIRVVFYYFLNGLLQPDLLIWLHRVSPDLIVLSSLWVIFRRYA
jgi:uncharacterized membrane protein YphA (DoxX/SURF4 family)